MIYIILWLFVGFIAVWRMYHGDLKGWYELANESYWDFDKRQGTSAIRYLLKFSLIFILCGLVSLLSFELRSNNYFKPTWWFTTKNK